MTFLPFEPLRTGPADLSDAVWLDVLSAVDRTYAELVDYQEGLERQNAELERSHDDLKAAQALLVRNEKFASLGRLLVGVAHELNNPISFDYTNAYALERYAGKFETYFDRVQAGASRQKLVGGRAMRDLIETVFTLVFEPPGMEDQARLSDASLAEPGARLALTTDSFVVTPLEFPGGDIGTLAVCGTVNELAVGGARPLWLSAAFIIEEGCEVALLHRVVASMAREAAGAGERIVSGDTKFVGRGSADRLFVTTAGVAVIPPGRDLAASLVRPGDVTIVNGMLGDHGATILAARGDLALSADLKSDCAGLGHLMEAVIAAAPGVRAAREATRGGLASALNEISGAAGVAS